jgi:hypothetical protein
MRFHGRRRKMSDEYYQVLLRTIAAAKRDPAELRALVFQLARVELRRELYKHGHSVSLLEARQQISALETAIEEIESSRQTDRLLPPGASTPLEPAVHSSAHTELVPPSAPQLPVQRPFTAEVLPPLSASAPFDPIAQQQSRFSYVTRTNDDPSSPIKGRRSLIRLCTELGLAATLAATLFFAAQRYSPLFDFLLQKGPQGRGAAVVSPNQDRVELAGQSRLGSSQLGSNSVANPSLQGAGLPLPAAYGVYAVSQGHLIDLSTLPIRVPDQRVAISGMISAPSQTTLADGHLQFIAFRRDLIDSAPDRVAVRVVARVMHALTFDSAGHPKLIDVDGSWAVRGNAYEMRIAPVSGHPEMILIRPEDSGFSFPAGRYALLLKNAAYDFNVAGPITDPVQCLERTDALNAPVYNECRTP